MSDGSQHDAPATVDPAAVRRAAMDLLARREHSLKELERKLQRRFSDGEALRAALHQLVTDNLQNDERFAESFARQRAGRGQGPLRIRQELRQRGLSDADIAAAFDQPGLDWCALAGTAFRKKFGEPAAVELKERARRARFMQYRGFDPEHYRHLIDT